jgi:thioredoxin 2
MATAEFDDRGIVVICPSCAQKNRLAYERLGESVRCGKCKEPLRAPAVPLEVSSAEAFDHLIANASLPVVVDYWAPWCGPCRMVGPIVDELATELAGKVRVAKLNVDDNPATAARFDIRSIPTLLVMAGGREVDRIVGALPKAAIRQRLDRALAR